MNFHSHLLKDLDQALHEVIHQGTPAPQVVEKNLKSHRKWGSRDRRFFAAALYDTVRWLRRNAKLLGSSNFLEVEPLALWAAGEMFADRPVPEEFEKFRAEVLDRRNQISSWSLKDRDSIPDWLDERGRSSFRAAEKFGLHEADWDLAIQAMNHEAPVDLRVNLSLATLREVQAQLLQEGIETEPIRGLSSGLTLRQRKSLTNSQAFKNGLIEVQDRSSQRVVLFLQAKPGELVIDACAGAGGKTLHLLDEVPGLTEVIAMDNSRARLNRLMPRLERRRGPQVRTVVVDREDAILPWIQKADRVLIDAPCSATGTFRRNPDRKWKLTAEELDKVLGVQSKILESYSRMVRPGGVLVYATCSILPEENFLQTRAFLERHSGWVLEAELFLRPDQDQGDGFYMARLKTRTPS